MVSAHPTASQPSPSVDSARNTNSPKQDSSIPASPTSPRPSTVSWELLWHTLRSAVPWRASSLSSGTSTPTPKCGSAQAQVRTTPEPLHQQQASAKDAPSHPLQWSASPRHTHNQQPKGAPNIHSHKQEAAPSVERRRSPDAMYAVWTHL